MPDAALAAAERRSRRRWARPGGGHDRRIATARLLLPVGIGGLAAVLVLAPLTGGGDVSFVLDKNKVDVAGERLRIQRARYSGQDGKGQPFTLTAASAVQKSSAEPVVQLTRLDAGMKLDGGPATIHADHGRYDMRSEQVATVGPVHIDGPRGYTLDTTNAVMDLKTRRLRSGGPATGTLTQGTFSADRLTADLQAQSVDLDGHARLRIRPRGAR